MIDKKSIVANDIIDMFQYVFQYFQGYKINKETRTLADDLLQIARADLEVCELLYANKKYSYAIERLQQSVEKASKAYVLYFGNVTVSGLDHSLSAPCLSIDKHLIYLTPGVNIENSVSISSLEL